MMQRSFDSIYGTREMHYGEKSSNELIQLIELAQVPRGKALDLGCGEGRDSLLLARNGFSVTAIDVSERGLRKLMQIATNEGLPIQCLLQDVVTFRFERERYELIVATTLLDHLETSAREYVVSGIKKSLKKGGFAYVEVFTTDDPGYTKQGEGGNKRAKRTRMELPPSECASYVVHYYAPGELRQQFAGLKVVLHVEKIEVDEKHGPLHYHGVARLVAQKAESHDTCGR